MNRVACLNLSDGKLHGKSRAILPASYHDPVDADDPLLASCEIAVNVTVVPAAVRFRHQDTHVLTNCFRFRVTELADGGGTERNDCTVLLYDDGGIRHRVQDRSKVCLACFQHLLRLACNVASAM